MKTDDGVEMKIDLECCAGESLIPETKMNPKSWSDYTGNYICAGCGKVWEPFSYYERVDFNPSDWSYFYGCISENR